MSDYEKKNTDGADEFSEEDFTLESILAEFKGNAYIDGDRRTPAEVLEMQTNRILTEAENGGLYDTEISVPEEKPADFFEDLRLPEEEILTAQTEVPTAAENASDAVDALSPDDEDDTISELMNSVFAAVQGVPDITSDEAASTEDTIYASESEPEAPATDDAAFNRVEPEQRPPREEPVSDDDPFEESENADTGVKGGGHDPTILFFDSYSSDSDETADEDAVDMYSDEVSGVIDRESREESRGASAIKKVSGFMSALGAGISERVRVSREKREARENAPEPEEPDLRETADRLAAGYRTFNLRFWGALIIALVIVILSFIFAASGSAPFGLGSNMKLFTAVLLIMQLIVMLLGIDMLIRGVMGLVSGEPGIETLSAFSCAATYLASFYTICSKSTDIGLPFCAVSAFSVVCVMWGERFHRRAMITSLRMAGFSASPTGVAAVYCETNDKTIVMKTNDGTNGFYNNLVQADVSELVYRYFTPVFMIAALVLAIITSVSAGSGRYFLYFLSAIAAASAAFPAAFAFSLPFSAIAKRVKSAGAAVAGWGGADDMYFTDGVRVADGDLFPSGTLSINGVKIFEGVRPDMAIRCTASLIISSGSGLSGVFGDLLENQGLSMVRISDFECYEGGVGGLIHGRRVLTGSSAFMNLMGIRIPEDMNMKNALFTAVNDTLIAVFAINYVPVSTVQHALMSMMHSRIKMFLAVRDFNITPLMIQQKFKVPLGETEQLPIKEAYRANDAVQRVAAVLCREGLGPLGEAVTSGIRLRSAAVISTVLSILSSVIGMLLMFFMCWKGTFASVNACNLFLYMLLMLIICAVVGNLAKVRR